MGVRYIGSKARVAESIVDLAGAPTAGRFVDGFCGTGAVAAAAARRGWAVTVNDSLQAAVALSVAAVVGTGNVRFDDLGGYESVISQLNGIPGSPGFFYAEYSPASAKSGGVERRYFTESNAARLDAIRGQIARWSAAQVLTWEEEQLLLADLMSAANSVANISGTYGCFLRKWSPNALRPLELSPRELPERTTNLAAESRDVFELQSRSEDVVYYDPPYTKRQYSAYYHILETLYAGDSPSVGGVTGLRPWRDKASAFCYKTKALDALRRLIAGTNAHTILLSYSNEGHVPESQLVDALSELGTISIHDIKTIGRYRPNAEAAAAGDTVNEYVVMIHRVTDDLRTDREQTGAVSCA